MGGPASRHWTPSSALPTVCLPQIVPLSGQDATAAPTDGTSLPRGGRSGTVCHMGTHDKPTPKPDPTTDGQLPPDKPLPPPPDPGKHSKPDPPDPDPGR